MFIYTTPSKKDFEIQSYSLLLPEELSKKASRLLHADIELKTMNELKVNVVSDKAFGHVPLEEIEIEYVGTCSVLKKGRYVTGKIRFIAKKIKYLGYYEPL